jgi:hypothetical protein
MTSSVANDFFFLLFIVVFFPAVVLKMATIYIYIYIFFLIYALTCILDPEAGGKGGALESHVMFRSKLCIWN